MNDDNTSNNDLDMNDGDDEDANYKLICLECKNEVDLDNYNDKLEEYKKDNSVRVVIECNHCATDHLVQGVKDDGELDCEVVEMEK